MTHPDDASECTDNFSLGIVIIQRPSRKYTIFWRLLALCKEPS